MRIELNKIYNVDCLEGRKAIKMIKYIQDKNYTLYQGNMLDMKNVINNNSIDCIITDPPYEIGFLGKSWDSSGIAFQKETWEKCFDVLKPGGYLLAFASPRTYHRIACAIEDAGFEIRDCIMWVYSSGFPKSMNIGLAIDEKNGVENEFNTTMSDFQDVGEESKSTMGFDKMSFGQVENAERKMQPIYKCHNEWNGWGSQLKPAYEPIIVARKPFKGTLVDNILEYGIGGLNIDECRVPFENTPKNEASVLGRFPANIITDGSEEVCSKFPNSRIGNNKEPYCYAGREYNNKETSLFNGDKPQAPSNYNDSGSASRYFQKCEYTEEDLDCFVYMSKTSKKDRNEGLEKGKNNHPTVKPSSLMRYLIRLVAPKGAVILDPFMGSGSTGKAVMLENKEHNKDYKFIGIDLTEEYLPIAEQRIQYANSSEQKTDKKVGSVMSEEHKTDVIQMEKHRWDI